MEKFNKYVITSYVISKSFTKKITSYHTYYLTKNLKFLLEIVSYRFFSYNCSYDFHSNSRMFFCFLFFHS